MHTGKIFTYKIKQINLIFKNRSGQRYSIEHYHDIKVFGMEVLKGEEKEQKKHLRKQ